MPSVSKKQQRLMGMAYGYAKGEMSKASDSVKKLSRSFIKGKRKGTKDYKKNIKILQNTIVYQKKLPKNIYSDFRNSSNMKHHDSI